MRHTLCMFSLASLAEKIESNLFGKLNRRQNFQCAGMFAYFCCCPELLCFMTLLLREELKGIFFLHTDHMIWLVCNLTEGFTDRADQEHFEHRPGVRGPEYRTCCMKQNLISLTFEFHSSMKGRGRVCGLFGMNQLKIKS